MDRRPAHAAVSAFDPGAMRTDRRGVLKEGSMETQISEKEIVNDLIEDVPGALAVFRRHGIDSCCGGHLTLEEAARSVGIDPYRLISELRLEARAAEATAEEVARHF